MEPYAITSNAVHVVFLGDSCHATTPFLGQGANVALRDAELLWNALKVLNIYPPSHTFTLPYLYFTHIHPFPTTLPILLTLPLPFPYLSSSP